MALQAPLRIPLLASNAWLVPAGEGVVLVDAGVPGMAGRLFGALAQHGVRPEAIRLIVISHVHYDHVGSLRAVQARSGAPVMVHAVEKDLLAHGKVVVPGGTNLYGVAATTLLKGMVRALPVRLAPCRAEHVVSGGESLADFGLEARVLHTPGHTAGSITVLCSNGDAVVGDLAVNHYPFGRGPIYPPFADDGQAVYASWRRLLEAGATRIYPGHGAPFPAGRLREKLARARPV